MYLLHFTLAELVHCVLFPRLRAGFRFVFGRNLVRFPSVGFINIMQLLRPLNIDSVHKPSGVSTIASHIVTKTERHL